jgi:HAD superfamily hydrolase (TIGR01459 family)
MLTIPNLSIIIHRYDALILDLWGVVHDGSHLYDGVHDALVQLKKADKKVIFLSNAPRRDHKVMAVLEHLGVSNDLYLEVMSSGEMGFRWLKDGNASWGKKYFYIGPAKDEDVVDGLGFTRVQELHEADFLLNVGFGSESQDSENWLPILSVAQAAGIPMLCLNPDLEVVKQTGERFECAGVLAHMYEGLGGKVTWFGKPYKEVYEHCFEVFRPIAKQRILAVGDSLDTDIPGAQNAGIDSVLVTGGILKTLSDAEVISQCKTRGLTPTYIMPQFIW